MLDVACPSCGETYHVSAEHVGKSLRCRRCDRVFEIAPLQPSSRAPAAATSPDGRASAPVQGTAAPAKPIEVTDQDFAHLRFVRLCSPKEMERWVESVAPTACRA